MFKVFFELQPCVDHKDQVSNRALMTLPRFPCIYQSVTHESQTYPTPLLPKVKLFPALVKTVSRAVRLPPELFPIYYNLSYSIQQPMR